MVDIISKGSGPREEDRRIRQLLDQNRGTITQLADHLSGGAFSARKAAPAAAAPEGRMAHFFGSAPAIHEATAHVRISPNGRVVLMDQNSGRQLQHLGDIRRIAGAEHFLLATAANGFIAPLAASVAAALNSLDGQAIGPAFPEASLAAAIEAQLDLA